MACVDQYVRLKNVRELIKTALRNKGVTVPDNTKYEGIPPLIDSIPEPKYQAKSVIPSSSQQIIKPDSGYDALSQVTVGAVSGKVTNITYDRTTVTNVLTFSQSVKGRNILICHDNLLNPGGQFNYLYPAFIKIDANGTVKVLEVTYASNIVRSGDVTAKWTTRSLNSAGNQLTLTYYDTFYNIDMSQYSYSWFNA